MVVFVDASQADSTISALADAGETAWRIGTVGSGAGEVKFA